MAPATQLQRQSSTALRLPSSPRPGPPPMEEALIPRRSLFLHAGKPVQASCLSPKLLKFNQKGTSWSSPTICRPSPQSGLGSARRARGAFPVRAAPRRCGHHYCGGSRGRRDDRERTAWNALFIRGRKRRCRSPCGGRALATPKARHAFLPGRHCAFQSRQTISQVRRTNLCKADWSSH